MSVRQVKQAGARMAVDVFKGFLLGYQMFEDFDQHDVLQNIGKIPGVKRMAVAEQGNSQRLIGITLFKHIRDFVV